MSNWKTWFETRQRDEKLRQLHHIWSDTFKALGVNGLSDEDAAHQSLSRINYNDRSSGTQSTFKGKQATLKRLENGQIFQRLLQLQDPDLVKAVEDAKNWLGHSGEDGASGETNASTTVSTLLQKMYGPYFQKLIDADFPDMSGENEPVAQVEPQPPMDNLGPEGPNIDGEIDPQADPTQQPQPQTQPPMPPMPGQPPQPPMPGQPPMQMAHRVRKGKGIFETWLLNRIQR